MRSFILKRSSSTQAPERPDIHDRFHHSPDEKACHQDAEIERIVSEKLLHVPHPLFVILLCMQYDV